MIFTKKKVLLLSTSIIAMVLILFLFIKPDLTKSQQTHQPIPTIFVHGFKGGPSSFNFMLARFQNDYHWGNKTMVCRVDKRGHVYIYGGLSNQKNPLIQVVFTNNRASIQSTTNWFKEIMEILSKQYHVKEIHAVGHSMGGLVLTNYIEQTANNPNYPKVQKLITIGSPFLGIKRESYYQNAHNTGPAINDLKTNSSFLRSLQVHRRQFSPNIKVLSIAGVVSNPKLGDGVVSLNSALGLQSIVNKRQYQKQVIYDHQATHSGLHDHPKVDQLIGSFLWGY